MQRSNRRAVMAMTWILLAGLATAPLSAQGVLQRCPRCPPTGPRADAASGSEYIIGPGDSLQVFIWRNAELSVTVPVRPDGKISTPLVEDMVAVGKTPSKLARDIEAVLAAYIRTPQVNVIVTNAVSTFSQVRVLGQVTTPQAVPYREGMTVLDAILAVGGLGEFAAGNRGKIVRVVNGKSQDIKVRIEDLVNDGDVSQNLPLKPGDVLVVPESRF
ncbi:MAG: polysaccharide biosynthesis/export family protein [Proteobacteria bacterium]|nr:polysaccharide biosynthesis/export family protein [Pseudomonadota bacterium]